MIKKGLKVGDTFVDGKKKYKVLKVNSDGTYISTSNLKDNGEEDTAQLESYELKEAMKNLLTKTENLEKENRQLKEALEKTARLEAENQKLKEEKSETTAFHSAEDVPPAGILFPSVEDIEPPHGDGADSSTDNADIVIVPKEE